MDSLTVGMLGPAVAAIGAINPTAGAISGGIVVVMLAAARIILPRMRRRREAAKKCSDCGNK
jgi:mannose/fructose/N-acetylgalactosamine-specific phosphotransferase system component IID